MALGSRKKRPKLSERQRHANDLHAAQKEITQLRDQVHRLTVVVKCAAAALEGEGHASLAAQARKYENPFYV